jgi:hypothetical protein
MNLEREILQLDLMGCFGQGELSEMENWLRYSFEWRAFCIEIFE